ncbi:hypothetical protein C8P68_101388 [Mucilaginibacter yixingensis]|uniref:DUF4142 domain-containing protein n=1 Tax=Mucilaginibacter yixingensis TaxID=1295612 RepID=A0A2T5JFH1_9SPHI|nr:hypothetical protein [Mucilaginibacter yixingensis]PTR01155.1 hypothetical protein C8P68_101388 [Mucilaginibacter yixingensis]
MKSKNFIYLILFSAVSFGACKKAITPINGAVSAKDSVQLVDQLKASATFNRFMSYNERFKSESIADKFNMSAQTRKNLVVLINKNEKETSIKQLADEFKKAGVDNAQDFITLNINRKRFYDQLVNEFPELRKINSINKVRLFKAAYYTNPKHRKLDYRRLSIQRALVQLQRSQKQAIN